MLTNCNLHRIFTARQVTAKLFFPAPLAFTVTVCCTVCLSPHARYAHIMHSPIPKGGLWFFTTVIKNQTNMFYKCSTCRGKRVEKKLRKVWEFNLSEVYSVNVHWVSVALVVFGSATEWPLSFLLLCYHNHTKPRVYLKTDSRIKSWRRWRAQDWREETKWRERLLFDICRKDDQCLNVWIIHSTDAAWQSMILSTCDCTCIPHVCVFVWLTCQEKGLGAQSVG